VATACATTIAGQRAILSAGNPHEAHTEG
jgi:hypothetical protein